MDEFSLAYQRTTPTRLSASAERQIEAELMLEKGLIEDPSLPISSYNYAAIRDRLAARRVAVSSPTIIARAKSLGCYQPHPRKKAHDREVVTTAIGALIQHDASHHRWSPYAGERWVLITSLDDFSRKILYADFFEQESTWAHIKAAERVMLTYGIPLRYYVDSLRVFRFVQGRDSVWRRHVLQADPQWRQVMRVLGVDVTYALSPAAKDFVAYCTSYASFDSILNSGCRSRFHLPLTGAFSSGGSNRHWPLSLYALARNNPRQRHFFTVSSHTPRVYAIS
jgi:hypothetical protein